MNAAALAWDAEGLLPVVVTDAESGAVLTLAYANREALRRTLAERTTWLYSRSRQELWQKGATSGNTQRVVAVHVDCDRDALLYRVVPAGPACHTGAASCFEIEMAFEDGPSAADAPAADGSTSAPPGTFAAALAQLRVTIAERRRAPAAESYTAALFASGIDRIAKKVGEEATEVVIAAKNDAPGEIASEVADLFYHTLVLLEERGVSLDAVGAELLRRRR